MTEQTDTLDETVWHRMLDELLVDLDRCEPAYRPTNFWGPGVERLLAEARERGLEGFKSWPAARHWFYPRYGAGFNPQRLDMMWRACQQGYPQMGRDRLTAMLDGTQEVVRDLHAVQLAWDQERWPFEILGHGESLIGQPPQPYRLTPQGEVWTKPYVNYLLCLAALSRHVHTPPRSFLELGGGFGVLGEIVTARDAEAAYVDCDIPPLVAIAAYYLDRLHPGGVETPADLPVGPFGIDRLGAIPSWRLPDLRGTYEVFVNSYSFQEMEPDVVDNYVDLVAGLGVEYAVSLNSRAGKRRASAGRAGGAISPVTSQFIVDAFTRRGFEPVGRYGEPLIVSAGELVVLRRG